MGIKCPDCGAFSINTTKVAWEKVSDNSEMNTYNCDTCGCQFRVTEVRVLTTEVLKHGKVVKK